VARTSKSDPLQIAELACDGGLLGLTFCPGKCGESVFGDTWRRDLTTDVDALVAWGAVTVVTLMEAHELNALKVSELGTSIEAAGLKWLHLPIRDLAAPGAEFEQYWVQAGANLHADLTEGGKVVIHCRGGRGRTGLVAAKLLIESGEMPTEAVRKVREARQGAIETKAQLDYVLQAPGLLPFRAAAPLR
jgi:ADP-ribosyl-[dinitrogen reductase] hydrolase